MKLTIEQALQQGIAAHKAGQIQRAERLYADILQAQSKHPDANHNMGVLAVGVSKVEEALLFFKAALEANPNMGQYWLSYINALIKLNRITDAKAVLVEAKGKGAEGEAFSQLEQRLNAPNEAFMAPPQNQLNDLINLYQQGQFQQTLDSAKQMLSKFPNSLTLYNIQGAANGGLGQFDSAINSYKQALKINPDFAEAYNNMGFALQNIGDLEAALHNYQQAIKIKPDYADAYYNMGNVLKVKGDLDTSIDSYKQALKIKPDSAEAYNNMGNALQNKGDSEAAIASYKQALKFNPDYANAYNNMGNALKDKGDLDASINSYKKAIELKPKYGEAHFNLGMLLLENNHYEQAAEHFKFNHENSKCYLLKCLYLQDKKSLFYDQLDYLINQDEIHPMIGSLGCRAELKYEIERPNLFCKDPLNYVLQTDLSKFYDFEEIFVSNVRTILQEHRVPNTRQPLLSNGYQTHGNLFSLERLLTEEIQKTIRLEIDKYLSCFKDSNQGLITGWPNDYSLYGWLVSMKSGGQLRAHMHEQGWISGSIYINVPSKSQTESGNLVVCIEEERLSGKNINQEKSIDVVTGSLCLFPASLLHYTIPFESEEERIVLAFDVVPKW